MFKYCTSFRVPTSTMVFIWYLHWSTLLSHQHHHHHHHHHHEYQIPGKTHTDHAVAGHQTLTSLCSRKCQHIHLLNPFLLPMHE